MWWNTGKGSVLRRATEKVVLSPVGERLRRSGERSVRYWIPERASAPNDYFSWHARDRKVR